MFGFFVGRGGVSCISLTLNGILSDPLTHSNVKSMSRFAVWFQRCHRNMCKSLRFALGGLLTDPTDAKYSRYVVERDENTTMYKFDKIDHKDVPLTVVVGVGKSRRFFLRIFQGDDHELCTTLDAANNIFSYQV